MYSPVLNENKCIAHWNFDTDEARYTSPQYPYIFIVHRLINLDSSIYISLAAVKAKAACKTGKSS